MTQSGRVAVGDVPDRHDLATPVSLDETHRAPTSRPLPPSEPAIWRVSRGYFAGGSTRHRMTNEDRAPASQHRSGLPGLGPNGRRSSAGSETPGSWPGTSSARGGSARRQPAGHIPGSSVPNEPAQPDRAAIAHRSEARPQAPPLLWRGLPKPSRHRSPKFPTIRQNTLRKAGIFTA